MADPVNAWRDGYWSMKHGCWFVKVPGGREVVVQAGSRQREYVQAYIDGYQAAREELSPKPVVASVPANGVKAKAPTLA